jgi:hypothetical protein
MALTPYKPTQKEIDEAMDCDFFHVSAGIEAGNLDFGRSACAAMAVLQHEVTRLRALTQGEPNEKTIH